MTDFTIPDLTAVTAETLDFNTLFEVWNGADPSEKALGSDVAQMVLNSGVLPSSVNLRVPAGSHAFLQNDDQGSGFFVNADGSLSFNPGNANANLSWAADGTWTMTSGDGDNVVQINPDGSISLISAAGASISVDNLGHISLLSNAAHSNVSINSDETISMVIGAGKSLQIDGLPTVDPHVVDHVWNNAGVMTLSAG